MNISTQEGSEYFRGLLVLISKDRVITESEVTLMLRVGKALGFEPDFTREAIDSILDNSYIKSDPPVFADQGLAKRFLRDGLAIARSDNGIHRAEAEWLRSVAAQNGIPTDWFETERTAVVRSQKNLGAPLEVDDFKVQR